MKRVLISAGVIVFAGLIAFKLYSNKQVINENNTAVDRSDFKIPVTVFNVQEVELSSKFSIPSVLEPNEEANIALNTAGKLKSFTVKLGSKVSKGQVIGSIDHSLKQLSVQSTQLQIDKLTLDYQRTKELYNGNASTKLDVDNAKYNLDNAVIQLASLKQQIADGSLISPINGIVTATNIEVGEFLNVGATAAKVVDVTTMKANVKVSERDVYRLEEGMIVHIKTDIYPDKNIDGKITFISPTGDASHNYQVEVEIKDVKSLHLKAGTFVSVEFSLESSEKVLEIPKSALVEGTKNPFVYVAKGQGIEVRKIIIGRDLGETIQVLDGLRINDRVIVSGQINLTSSSKIEVVNTTK